VANHRTDLGLVAPALGSDVVGATEPEWGDRAATVRADLADGRVVAVRRLDGPGAGAAARRIAGIAAHLEAAGLPVSTPSLIESEEAIWLARDLAKKVEAELTYPGQIKVTVIRETRSVEYAR